MAELFQFGGERLPLDELAKRAGISVDTVRSRLRIGWKLVEALNTPPYQPRRSPGQRPLRRPCPVMRFHKPTKLGYASWKVSGRRFWKYFGPWESAKAKTEYRLFRAEWAAGLVTQNALNFSDASTISLTT